MAFNFSEKLPQRRIIVVMVGLFAFGIAVGMLFSISSKNVCVSKLMFVNRDLACGKPAVIEKTGYKETQGKISVFIQGEKEAGRVTEAAVYFRDLRNGPIFGINETTDFAPASLLKLPLALVYLTQAERNPKILEERLSVEKPQWSFAEAFHPTETIKPQEPHTVEDLLKHMLSYSDNNAYGVLQTHFYETGQKDMITQVFLELGFIDPANIYDEVMSVRQYGSIFRALYNISYLNAELSEKVLGWLADSDFKIGLKAGVPEDIVVAHKFGERIAPSGAKQLHDCGIVYYPENPYLLCVMTRGRNFDDLSTIIRHISDVVYTEVDSRRE
ncbi:MAG: serine hydrolase [Candidatus Paceibacterota bacterium]|jgi:hypothetical protein